MIASQPKARQASRIHSLIYVILLNGGLAGAIMLAYYLFGQVGVYMGLLVALFINIFIIYERNRESIIEAWKWVNGESEDFR